MYNSISRVSFYGIIETNMAVAVRSTNEETHNCTDITHALPSLQFESALSDEENNMTYIRKRFTAHAFSACAQASYFVAISNEIRFVTAVGWLHGWTGKRLDSLVYGAPPHRRPALIFLDDPPSIYEDDGHNNGFLMLHKSDKIWLDTKKKIF